MRTKQGHPIWNERFARFANHHGFLLRRCAPYRPRTKGKVENGVGYVRKNFWPRVRTFTCLTDLNIQVRLWLDTVANVRIHGTTHEVPQQRLLQEELKTFNLVPFDTAERHPRKVSNDALISYAANRYSVPWRYVGQTVELQDERNGRIRIFQQAHLNNTITHKMRALTKPNLLIIDEIGYRKMDETAAHFFFQIIAERYESGSIILTSNKSYGAWGEIFGDSVLATAILDRLLHHSTTINIKGESYRIKEKKKAGFFRPDTDDEKTE